MSNLATGFINDVYAYGNTGSSMANAVSYGAQQNQFDFNSTQAQEAYNRQIDLANMQMAFNSAQAADQRAYNEAMWEKSVQANRENASIANLFSSEEAEKNRQFNAEQAELARQWQERMSNTQYQRAVQDMKAAGINPILASLNGGNGWSSGASASGSSASASMANSGMASSGMASMSQVGAPSTSGSAFTGQGNNMSENLAIFGAIASMFGQGMSGLAESIGLFGQSLDLSKFADDLGKAFRGDSKATGEAIEEVGNALGIGKTGGGLLGLFDKWFGNSKYNQHSEANTDFWERIDKYTR